MGNLRVRKNQVFDYLAHWLLIPILVVLFVGFSVAARAADVTMLSPPAQVQSHLSRLTSDNDGRLWLSWVSTKETSDEAPSESSSETSNELISRLHYAHYAENRWSAARQIAQGSDWFVNWADFPFLSVHDEGMVAHWLRKRSAGTYDYDVVASFYSAAEDVWGPPITIHKDGVSAEHGFVSMLPMPEGRTFIAWLDGRNTAPMEMADSAAGHVMMLGMTLRGGIFTRQGETLQEWQLDDLTCDCCQTSVATAAAGPVVVYRDRTIDEIRDIYITRLIDGRWTEAMPVHEDNWQVAGCPVNGPAVVAQGQRVAVAWFSAKDDQPQVKLAFSVDGGASFGLPIVVDEGETNGRVSLVLMASGDVAVSWLATKGAVANIKIARYNSQGELRDSVNVATTRASRRSGFPVLASVGDDLYLTWTDLVDDSQVKVAQISF